MEKLSLSSLPVAFTFSVLCNILPFYEKLPKWMWLLKLLNSETKKLWEDYEQEFMNCSQDYKLEMNSYHDGLNRPSLEIYKRRQRFYGHFYLKSEQLALESMSIFRELEDNTDHEMFDTDLHFVDESTLQYYIPAVNCPNFKAEVQEFPFTDYSTLSSIGVSLTAGMTVREELMKGGVLIRKIEDNNIRLESMISSIMPVDAFDVEQDINDQIERYSKCSITDCCCKPKALLAARFDFLNTINIYKALQTIKDIKKIIVYDCDYWIDGGNLQNPHNFMKYYPDVKIMHSQIDFDNTKSISKTITLAYPSFLIINIYNATPTKCDCPEMKIEGNVIKIITINNESWILFEIGKLSSRKFIIQDDSKSFTNVLNDQTLTKRIEDIRNKDKNAFCLLFKLNNIIKFETTTVDSISTLSKSKMLRSIQINVKFGEFELNELIQHFYSIPRHLHLGFRISFVKHYPSEENEIWKFILKIKNIELQSQSSKVFKVIEKIGESNIDDLNESSFKVLIDSVEQEVTFKDLYRLLKDSH